MPSTLPSRETRAMAVSELQNVNLADGIRLPCRSYAVAKIGCLWPTPSVIVSGVTWTSLAVWAGEVRPGRPRATTPPGRKADGTLRTPEPVAVRWQSERCHRQ